ncbi:hypothetical protein [Photorhabdus noenieputensis]|uniref:hypothetical protein n=1 Tax=Photorhabdus noenieputensis TaxID=1208607 RepID=UPI001BD4FFBB|nr:hypothetical protein [Photorhabdus noenieputensis]MCK3667276.1 hypothetical protein [Photorhabdus noenieputensis]
MSRSRYTPEHYVYELIPRSQHQAPGAVQKSLHPNQEGGFKKLGSGKCGGL